MKIKVTFFEANQNFSVGVSETNQNFRVVLDESSQMLPIDFGDIQRVIDYADGDPYAGDYEMTPKVAEQVMRTKEKIMLDDVTVHAIPFFNVSNTSGGSTVYIGSEV